MALFFSLTLPGIYQHLSLRCLRFPSKPLWSAQGKLLAIL
jgi:hypothetical protein